MPSAFQVSRDFAANAIARVRSGLNEYDRQTKMPGQEIKVEPFDAQNVSTPAAFIKLGTSIAAVRRHKANLQEAQKNVELEREKNREQIALIRAQTAHQLAPTKGAAVLGRDVGQYKAGTPLTDVTADMAERRIGLSAARERESSRSRSRLSAAKAGLTQIDAEAGRQAAIKAQAEWQVSYGEFSGRIANPGTRDRALAALGINPAEFSLPYSDGGPGPQQKAKMLSDAYAAYQTRILTRNKAEALTAREADRKKYQQIIDEEALGAGQADEGSSAGDINALIQAIQNAGQD